MEVERLVQLVGSDIPGKRLRGLHPCLGAEEPVAVLALHDVNGGDWDGPRWSDERSFDGPDRPGLPDAPDSDR